MSYALWVTAGVVIAAVLIALAFLTRYHAPVFRTVLYLAPPPGMTDCPVCGGDGGLVKNQDGELVRVHQARTASHHHAPATVAGRAHRKALRSHESTSQVWDCPRCRGSGYVVKGAA